MDVFRNLPVDADIVGDKSLWQELEVLSLYNKAFMDLKIEGLR